MEKNTPCNRDLVKKVWVAIPFAKKFYFKARLNRKENDYDILVKGTIQQEEKIIINTYGSNTSTPNYIKSLLTYMKSQIKINTIKTRKLSDPVSQ